MESLHVTVWEKDDLRLLTQEYLSAASKPHPAIYIYTGSDSTSFLVDRYSDETVMYASDESFEHNAGMNDLHPGVYRVDVVIWSSFNGEDWDGGVTLSNPVPLDQPPSFYQQMCTELYRRLQRSEFARSGASYELWHYQGIVKQYGLADNADQRLISILAPFLVGVGSFACYEQAASGESYEIKAMNDGFLFMLTDPVYDIMNRLPADKSPKAESNSLRAFRVAHIQNLKNAAKHCIDNGEYEKAGYCLALCRQLEITE